MVSAALPLVLSHVALCAVLAGTPSPVFAGVVFCLAFLAFIRAARRLEDAAGPLLVLVIAGLLRLALLPLPPTALSEDMLRYVWDGRVVRAGFNPYALAPDSEELAGLRDDLWRRMPHREVPTVYPPLALAVFAAADATLHPMVSLKILLVFVELVGCWLLLILASRLGIPPGRSIWYAWNPLAVLEIAGSGHIDALVVTASIGAVLALTARRPLGAAALAVAGTAGKLVPLLALPLWTRVADRPWRFAAAAVLLLVVVLGPVALSVGGVPPGLVRYGVSWEFNGPIYEPLWRLFDQLDLAPAIKDQLDEIKQGSDDPADHAFWNRFYPLVYPQLLAKLVLALAFGFGVVLPSLRRPPPERRPQAAVLGSGRFFGGLLLCMATVYPWYLLWVLPWAALARHRAWLAASGLVLLAYLPELGGPPLFPWLYAVIWIPFFLLLFKSRWTLSAPERRSTP